MVMRYIKYFNRKDQGMKIMREDILKLLENDSRLTEKDIAAMIGADEAAVAAEIKAMEKERIICGYHTMINWDKMPAENVTALIELKVSPMRGDGYDRTAERISKFDEVSSVYLLSGSSSDIIITIEGRTLKEVSHFVAAKIAPMESVLSTATHFILKKYKDHSVIYDTEKGEDERIQVMP
jgi:DNA-binding Lrp family transcriptional regulator